MGIANKLNSVAKYVVSTSLTNAAWQHTTIIRDNVIDTIRQLKQEKGTEIQVEGSAELVKSRLGNIHGTSAYTFSSTCQPGRRVENILVYLLRSIYIIISRYTI